jgi:hypothetical protein
LEPILEIKKEVKEGQVSSIDRQRDKREVGQKESYTASLLVSNSLHPFEE